MNTYLGQKGYTILKTELTASELQKVKTDLTIRPHVPGAPVQETATFPAYRESSNKIYVPHYYGVEQFGPPKEYKISEGQDIQLEFMGQMRDQQVIAVNTYIDHVRKAQYGGGLLELPCGAGKCLAKDTPILMYDGDIKCVQDIRVGDLLMGDDSTPRTVLSLARGKETMYKIKMNDFQEHYVCNESHILSLYHEEKKKIVDISVKNYLALSPKAQEKLFGYKASVEFPLEEAPEHFMNSFLFGYWIFHTREENKSETNDQGNTNDQGINNDSNNTGASMSTIDSNNNTKGYQREKEVPKRIPKMYKCSSRENRRAFIGGILTATSRVVHENEELINDILFIYRSLGFACYKRMVLGEDGVTQYEIINLTSLTTNITVEKLQVDDYYGFEINGNRRFVMGDFTVTHNTVNALKIISLLQKKTFIIVHKEFLMNQWIERIQQFLPTATIGKIQGQIVDVDGKDIVIGMLQSLSMKEYPVSLFESFGLTIIDEVHHISSQVFSNSLFKLVTKYMLGLSATMTRKDGTTKVFKMFLGDVVYKGQRDEVRAVTVRAIDYYVNDYEFNHEALDQRGKPAYSTMISKLCEYNRRTEFILLVLVDMLRENPNQQIMFLAHNKNVLTYLYDAIKHKDIATVGYYIGGMKESALKETESKKVVIATYSMAAEALDIKTLSTLIMVTPKTDIEQSVGRILREKHSQPIVVDIIDSHSLFQRQWEKRRAFYMRENYKIVYTTSVLYQKQRENQNNSSNEGLWETICEPGVKRSKLCKRERENEKERKNNEDSLSGTCFLPFNKILK